METSFEYIVVGSGPGGAMAAQTLTEAGRDVTMIDVGEKDEKYSGLVPELDFETLRRSDPEQYRYLLGDDFEGVPWEELKAGAQLTPARKAMIKSVDRLTPLLSSNFQPMESLGYGGLGAGWGLGCYVYSDAELFKTGLEPKEMNPAYQEIADRIGISSGADDIETYVTGQLDNLLPPLKMDNATQYIYKSYVKKRKTFNKKGIYLGHPAMALLTRDTAERQQTRYFDMDFYTDQEKAAWRAWMTIDKLKEKENFRYISDFLVLTFKNENEHVVISAKNKGTGEIAEFKCRKLILAAGTLGTARIVMRSLKEKLPRLPLLSNPYAYIPCLNLHMLGKALSRFKTSMAQAFMIYDPDGKHDDLVSVSLYTYRSLLLHRLVKELPLDYSEGRIMMKYLQSALVVAGIHHPDEPGPDKYLALKETPHSFTGDTLFANYELNEEEKNRITAREKLIRGHLRKLGCIPLRRIDPGYGASIHYGGTLPFNRDKEMPGSVSPEGRLNITENVFIADGSSFKYLPAKGITLTLMANAHRVALNALR